MSKVYIKNRATVDLAALGHNYLSAKEEIIKKTPKVRIMCVVKADAYGHGVECCVRRLSQLGAESFGVSCIEEAREVKKYCRAGSDILILGYTPAEYATELAESGYIQTVYSSEYAEKLSSEAVNSGCTVRIHIKADTGMSRIGFSACDPEDCARDIKNAMALRGLKAEGIFTHFARADEPSSGATELQHSRFLRILELLGKEAEGLCVHCCNSAAALLFPEFRHDMVRLGIVLYGLPPADGLDIPMALKPVMRLTTTVTEVHALRAGESVSYGWHYTAERDMRIATLGIGYADGFMRAFSNGGGVLINGRFMPVIGSVCMDQVMVAVGDEDVKVGDEAEIFDCDGVNIKRLMRAADTISYELVCAVSKRVQRTALG